VFGLYAVQTDSHGRKIRRESMAEELLISPCARGFLVTEVSHESLVTRKWAFSNITQATTWIENHYKEAGYANGQKD
jgi:hypothetical protein